MNDNLKLIDVPFTRVPVCLALDTSGSMAGEKIEELNRGIEAFYNSVMSSEEARFSVDLSIVSFGKGGVNKILNFDMITNQVLPRLEADDLTPMGEGIREALNMLENRKTEYKTYGNQYYQPWLVIMTDGFPTDDYKGIAQEVSNRVLSKKLSVFPIAIGDADTNIIEEFSPKRRALRLKGLNFVEFFEWLSQSVVSLSQSNSEQEFRMNTDALSTWAEL